MKWISIIVIIVVSQLVGCAMRGEVSLGYNGDNGESAQVKIHIAQKN